MSCWWTIHEEAILEMLRRVAAGESPDEVYAEFYVNAESREDHSSE